MDGKQWLDRSVGPLRDTLQKLSRAQQLSLGILGVALLVALGTLISSGSGEENWKFFPIAEGQSQVLFTSWLEAEGIPHRIDSGQGGVRIPRAQAEAVNLRANMMRAAGQNTDNFAWVNEAANWQESRAARADRYHRSILNQLASTLSGTHGILQANVEGPKKEARNRIYARGEASGASIQLIEDRNFYPKGIPPEVARGAAQYVAGALGVPSGSVSVYDSRMQPLDTSANGSLGRDSRLKGQYEADVTGVLELSFAPTAFKVVVNPLVTSRRSQERTTLIDPENTVSLTRVQETEESSAGGEARSPGVKTNVALGKGDGSVGGSSGSWERTRKENAVDYGKRETTTEIPAGELEGVSILVAFGMDSVLENLRQEEEQLTGRKELSEEERPARIESFKRKWEQDLRAVFPPNLTDDRLRITVMVNPLPPVPVKTAFREPNSRGVLTWASSHGVALLIVLLTTLGGFFLLRAARSGAPDIEELPDPVAEYEDYLEALAERSAEEAVAGVTGAANREPWTLSEEDSQTLGLLEDVTSFAQENADTAGLVVRQWLQKGPVTPKGSAP